MQKLNFYVRKNRINKIAQYVISNDRNYVYCACYK